MKSEDKKVYEIIEKNLNLTEQQLDEMFETNKYLSQIMPQDILQQIMFYEKLGINKENIAKVALQNPWFLTESFERIRYIQSYLAIVGITDLNWMAINHPISLSVNPITIKDFIEDKRLQGKTDEQIKEDIMNNFEQYFSL